MKTLKVMLSAFFYMAMINGVNAQTYYGNAVEAIKKLQLEPSQYNLITSQNSRPLNVNNSTRVLQIGDYNTSFSLTKSNSSDIQLTQIGNNNDVSLIVSANRIEENITQIGYNHSFTDLNVGTAQLHAANVFQLGANQNLIWLGNPNSISDNMIVTMQGRNQTIIVRNLKN